MHSRRALAPALLAALDLLPQTGDGATPLATLHLGGADGYLFGVERATAHSERPAPKLNRDLRHEGLDQALAARRRRARPHGPWWRTAPRSTGGSWGASASSSDS